MRVFNRIARCHIRLLNQASRRCPKIKSGRTVYIVSMKHPDQLITNLISKTTITLKRFIEMTTWRTHPQKTIIQILLPEAQTVSKIFPEKIPFAHMRN
jgi:hypothetical protein